MGGLAIMSHFLTMSHSRLFIYYKTCDEHVSRPFILWTFFQCALDLRFSIGFFCYGILRLSSSIFNSPLECDVI